MEISIKQRNRAMIEMAICASLWSIAGIFIKLIGWNPVLIAGSRSAIAGLVLYLYMRYSHIPIKVCRYSIGAGIGLGFSALMFVVANKLTTAANAIVLQYCAPIFVIIISALFFKERFGKKEIGVVSITTFGIVLFFFDQLSPGNIIGNIISVVAGIFLALMFVMTGKGGQDDSIRMSGILFAHIIIVVIGIVIGPALGLPEKVYPIEIISLLALGIFQLGIPYVLYARASKNCSPLACSLIGILEPLLNPVWVAIFAHEFPGFYALIGAVVIISTVTWWCFNSR